MNNLELFFYYFPIAFCFLSAATLLLNRKKQLPHRYLAGFFTILGCLLLSGTIKDVAALDIKIDAIIYFFNVLLNIFCAISVLFYFIVLMQPQKLTRRYIFFFAGLSIFYMIVMSFEFLGTYHKMEEQINVFFRLLGVACEVSLEIYTITTVTRMYFRHRKFIQENYSYEEEINFRWVFVSNGALILLAISGAVWNAKGNSDNSIFFNLIVFAASFIVFLLGYKNVNIPVYQEIISEDKADDNISVIIPSSRQIRTKETLISYFEKEKPYLNSSLSLNDIAIAINCKPAYLSRLLKKEFNVNFYTFVNNYRLDYAILLIKDDKNLIIKNLYLDTGFKSRSVFYRLFRERTGASPKEYLSYMIKK